MQYTKGGLLIELPRERADLVTPFVSTYTKLAASGDDLEKESMPIRVALTSAHLRVYVDEWLQTGRHADGSEWPGQRDLHKAHEALSALWDYL